MRRPALILLTCLLAACPDNDPSPDAEADGGRRDATPAPDAAPREDAATEDAASGDARAPDAEVPDAGPGDAAPGMDAAIPVTIAYGANAEQILIQELYLTESNLARAKVTPVLAGGPAGGEKQPLTGGVRSFAWTNDGSAIVYEAQQETYDLVEVYLARISGGRTTTSTKISFEGSDDDAIFELAPVGSQVLVYQTPPSANTYRMFSVDTSSAAPAPAQVSQGLALSVFWHPSGRWGAYQDIIQSMNDRDLWIADLASAPSFTRERVNPGANNGFGSGADWSPDGTRIVYVADELALRDWELFTATFTNGVLGPRERVHPALAAAADVSPGRDIVHISPDGRYVAYLADLTIDNVDDLVVSDLSVTPFGMPEVLSTARAMSDGVTRFLWVNDSQRIVYAADEAFDGVDELFVATLGAAGSVRVHTPLSPGQTIQGERWARDGELLVYRVGDADSDQLWSSDLRGATPGVPAHLSVGLEADESVTVFDLSPDTRTLLFQTRREKDRGALYVLDLRTDPPGPPIRLAAADFDTPWCWASDGRLAIGAELDHPVTRELYLLPDPLVSAPIRISGPMIDGARVFSCAFPP